MSGSRKSLKKRTAFNPRASNEWSKDDSKFGQKMLEKMGWKHGEGIGLNNQGITENIKVRLKLDNKGLGYQIKEDPWLEVRSEFSELLSQLSQGVEDIDEAVDKDKKSLEAVSQSCKTRVHYHKFTHGKDIARYKKEDLIGILGKKESKDESLIPENKEFIQSGNMLEYFESKKKKSKSDDSDLPSVHNVPTVDDQSNESKVKPAQKEDTSDLKNNSKSRKRKIPTKLDDELEIVDFCENELIDKNSTVQNEDTSNLKNNSKSRKRKIPKKFDDEHEIVDLCENESTDENSAVRNEGTSDLKNNSKSRKRKIFSKLNDKHEIVDLCDNELIDENSASRCTDETKSDKSDNICRIGRKKKRSLDIPPDYNDSKVFDLSNNVNLKNIPEDNSKLNSKKRKKSSEKLQKGGEIEELSENTTELITIESISENEFKRQNKKPNKKKTLKSTIEPKNNVALDEKIQATLHVELDKKIASEVKFDENIDINLRLENSNEKKKKKYKKSDRISTGVRIEENENLDGVEKKTENNENETIRKEKHKSNHTEEQPTLTDDTCSTNSASLQVIDDSTHRLKTKKAKSKKNSDSYLNDEKNETVLYNSSHSVQKNVDVKTKAFNSIESNSADFMKSVIDYNSYNNVEDFISEFEKNREQLLNKYREKYKMKYSMSKSDKIEVFGDEFDGRKLDCKKPISEDNNMPLKEILNRKNMSKAQKIVAKARLLQMIKDKTVTHDFAGSNLTNISGYGNVIS